MSNEENVSTQPLRFPGKESGFSLEAKIVHLEEQLVACRKKLKNQRRELKRLHKGYDMMLHASRLRNADHKSVVEGTVVVEKDILGNPITGPNIP
jgi:hypothetical protein